MLDTILPAQLIRALEPFRIKGTVQGLRVAALRAGGLNVSVNRRSNKRLNATAHTLPLINLGWGGTLPAALDALDVEENHARRLR
jgi:hypothetical protein